jgi:hypothetical protein
MGKGSRFASFTVLFALLLLVSGIPAAANPVPPPGALAGNLDQRAARITSGLKDLTSRFTRAISRSGARSSACPRMN